MLIQFGAVKSLEWTLFGLGVSDFDIVSASIDLLATETECVATWCLLESLGIDLSTWLIWNIHVTESLFVKVTSLLRPRQR